MQVDLKKFFTVTAIMSQGLATGCIVDIDPFDSLTDEAGDGDGDTTDDSSDNVETSEDNATTDDDVGTDDSTGDGDGDTTADTTADDTTDGDTTTDGGETFTCTDGTMIPAEWVCDEEPDCPDNSDEVTGCGIPAFVCADGTFEIPEAWVCDTVMDCLDGSDEMNCE